MIQGIKLSFDSKVDRNGFTYKNEAGDEAEFTIRGEDVFGSLKTIDGRSFSLERCKSRTVWIEYDMDSFTDELEPESAELTTSSGSNLLVSS